MSPEVRPGPVVLRPARPADLPALSALCLRSKAHWGYDADFINACRDELTLHPRDLQTSDIQVAEQDATLLGMVAISRGRDPAELSSLFIEPKAIGTGLGKTLFDWAVAQARAEGAQAVRAESDPFAEAFYASMGMVRIGESPSGSIPGRVLPLMQLRL